MQESSWSGRDKITVRLLDLINIGSLFVLGLVLAASYGFQYKLQGPQRELYFTLFTVPFVGCLLALLIIPFVQTGLNGRIVQIPKATGLLPIFAMFMASVFFYADNLTALSVIGFSLSVFIIAYARFGFDAVAYLIIAAGFMLFCILLIAYPIDVNSADMLPYIEAAAAEYLRGGDVYTADFSQFSGGRHFGYLPLQWLVYVPLVAADIDMRLLHIIFATGTLFLFIAFLAQDLKQIMILSFWPVMLSPMSAGMFFNGQVWLFWFLITGFLIAFINERLVLAAIILGIVLATRQTSLAIAAAVAVFMISRIPMRKYFILMAIVILIYSGLTLPFAGRLESFFSELYFLSEAVEINLRVNRNPMNQVALVNWIYVFGIESMRLVLQIAAGGFFLLLIFLMRSRDTGIFLILMGVMFLVVISLNGQIFRYYYVPGLIIASFGVAVSVTSASARCSSAKVTAVV